MRMTAALSTVGTHSRRASRGLLQPEFSANHELDPLHSTSMPTSSPTSEKWNPTSCAGCTSRTRTHTRFSAFDLLAGKPVNRVKTRDAHPMERASVAFDSTRGHSKGKSRPDRRLHRYPVGQVPPHGLSPKTRERRWDPWPGTCSPRAQLGARCPGPAASHSLPSFCRDGKTHSGRRRVSLGARMERWRSGLEQSRAHRSRGPLHHRTLLPRRDPGAERRRRGLISRRH